MYNADKLTVHRRASKEERAKIPVYDGRNIPDGHIGQNRYRGCQHRCLPQRKVKSAQYIVAQLAVVGQKMRIVQVVFPVVNVPVGLSAYVFAVMMVRIVQ